MPHTQKKLFYPKPFSFSNKLSFDVANILIIFQRESEKTILKSDFEKKTLQRVTDFELKKMQGVRFRNETFTTCQILN